jgi:mRNA-degrading endonuclease RelE of RelBE toxin-antitoxin system
VILYIQAGVEGMEIKLKKQPEKYLDKCAKSDFDKINNALIKLKTLQGDIKKLAGREDEYRVKIPPFRIIFTYDKANKVIIITKIDTRGDAYKKG